MEVARPAETLEERTVVGRGQLAALDVLLELFLDLAPLGVERPRGGLRHDRLVARAGRGLRDPEAHLSRSEDANASDLHRGGPVRQFRCRRQSHSGFSSWAGGW